MIYNNIKISLLFLIAITLFVLGVFSLSAQNDSPYEYSKQVNDYIRINLQDCKVVTFKDYGDDTLEYFKPTKEIIGDFDGNGLDDICLIIKCKNNVFKVVSFHKTKTSFNHHILETVEDAKYTRSTLGKEGPGSVVISMADEEVKRSKIHNIAIRIEWIETCYDVLYIWDKTKYISYYRGA